MSISLNKSLLSLFKCIIFTEKKINDLRNSIISYNNVNIIIYNIFKKDKINSQDFMLFLNSNNNYYINNFLIDDIKTMIKFNSKNFFHSYEDPFLNFNELYKLFTGNYNSNKINNELNWFRNYNNLYNSSETYNEQVDYVDYEIKFSMFKILENEIDFTNNLKQLINNIKKKYDFDLINIFNLLCDKKNNIINENSLYEFFIKNYEKIFISKEEMKYIINIIDFDNKNYINYNDLKKFFNIDYNNINNNLNNFNKNINKNYNLNQSKNETIQKFFYYIKQLFDYENYIEQLKYNIINQHLDFSIEKFYEFLSLDKNFDINNLFKITIPFKQLKLNFSKLKVYFSNDFELFFLLNRTNIYIYNSPITFNVIYKLLMPSFYQLIPEHVCLNKIDISKDTLTDIKNLINVMISCEVSMNNFKKFFNENSPDIIFNDIINFNYNDNNNNKVSFITYYTFYNYVKCNNILNVDDDNIKSVLEIIFNRINKSNNGKLSLFDLNKELNYI